MKTFEFNNTTKKAEAAKNKHDDAIMAIAIAIYARDQSIRDIPLGMIVSDGLAKANSKLDDIRQELRKGLKDDLLDRIRTKEKSAKDFDNEILISMYRKKDSLLREFGW